MPSEEWRAGYDQCIRRALELEGDLARIHTDHPPAVLAKDWRDGYHSAKVDLIDLLLPDGADLHNYLAQHQPTTADRQAIEALHESAAPISLIRTGLSGQDTSP